MIYTTGSIAVSGNTLTGTGTNFTAAGSLIRNGCTVLALTSPVQAFQITSIDSATGLTVTPAAIPAVPAGTKFAILLSDSLSVDGLAQDIAETFSMYQRYMGGFADVMNSSGDVTITINGQPVTVPGQKSLAKKGANADITSLNGLTTAITLAQGGTGAKTADDARTALGVPAGTDAQMCTAWALASGVGVLKAGNNISSVTLLQTGILAFTFATPMKNNNYAVTASFDSDADAVSYFSSAAATRSMYIPEANKTANGFRVYMGYNASPSGLVNFRGINVSVFGGK